MAEVCCGVVGEVESTTTVVEPVSRKHQRIEMLPLKFMADARVENGRKKKRLDLFSSTASSLSRDCAGNALENSKVSDQIDGGSDKCGVLRDESAKFGMTSICGRRRDMEDAVSIHVQSRDMEDAGFDFYGVFDGHGCSHVAVKCKNRLHEIVREETGSCVDDSSKIDWKSTLERSFARMDDEVQSRSVKDLPKCRCELQTPHCEAVGSTAVVAVVTPDKIILSNCGDSRAVLCRNGVAIPLSTDHKPDRADELLRIEAAGGRVIYWDGARVLGVLAMSRAIGDSYLKPYVISEPEVTITERSAEDECLILASDGLWDVVSNEIACGVAGMCLRAERPKPPHSNDPSVKYASVENSDKSCSDAAILLTKLALARHSTDNVSVVVVDLRKKS